MKAKIEMPTPRRQKQQLLQPCIPTLMRDKRPVGSDDGVCTIVATNGHVVVFTKTEIMYLDDMDWLYENYEFIREYNPGETLSVTV